MQYVAYYRVSTQKQGVSGLGLEAQQRAVTEYVIGKGEIIAPPFVEIESGRKCDRPELAKALAHAKRNKATLIVAKLDRLARDTRFVLGILDEGVEFVAVDMPSANRFMLTIIAAMAEYEAQLISQRTKAGLASRRARGLPLGNIANLQRGNSPAAADNRRSADEFAERMRPVVDELTASGVTGAAQLAAELNRRGYNARAGGQWHTTSAARLLMRLSISPVSAIGVGISK